MVTAGLLGHWGFGPRGVDSLQERVARGSRRLRFENSLEDSQASPPHQTWPVMQPYPLAPPPRQTLLSACQKPRRGHLLGPLTGFTRMMSRSSDLSGDPRRSSWTDSRQLWHSLALGGPGVGQRCPQHSPPPQAPCSPSPVVPLPGGPQPSPPAPDPLPGIGHCASSAHPHSEGVCPRGT